jgi:hypothetical protein
MMPSHSLDPLFAMHIFGLVMDTCIRGATWCVCVMMGSTKMCLWASPHTILDGQKSTQGKKKEEASNAFVLVTSIYTYNVRGTNSCTCEP